GGRAPAEMELRESPALRQPLREQFDFASEQSEVGNGHLFPWRNYRVASAEQAALLAERQVHVHRQRGVAERVRGGETVEIVVGGDSLVKLDRRRVARIARPRPVVAREQVDRDGAFHWARGRNGRGFTDGGIHDVFSACTASTSACTLSMGGSGVMPWPRVTMWPP